MSGYILCTKKGIIAEFFEGKAVSRGGADFAKDLIERSKGQKIAAKLLENTNNEFFHGDSTVPFDFLKCPELVFEEFTRRYVDGQRLAYISFELAEMYKRYLTDEFMTLLKEGRGYFGLIPLMRQFSDIGDAIKEEAIKALWRDEKGNVRYDFLGHGLERVYPETQELFGRGPIESFIYVRRERRDIPKRKRAHIVINPETELAYYIFKVPVGEADRLTKGKPLVTYQEECTAFRQPVFCAVFEPVEGMISPEIARKYREIKK